MNEAWKKTSLAVESTKEDGKTKKRSFNNIAQGATDEQLVSFGQVIAQLTGEATDQVTVNVTSVLA
ncbi:hypothetical protein LFYK43_22410 [Ligilactobacillus salitolerans]|uniref:DUF1659 domain-containing protein n=1 Tax=Ligilactobacillus salitolerans TaxID=1808352 RepID=A0A401IW91_9LACO|nr:DUF1659 domain-containing protein [Ligilactobacillus salitolerans]GBG95782.1 hypothetical protein LFYK43_22410 [Ligilactobacillus salitolerans]